ncbi:MAG: hypothetical protein ACJ76J_19735 [Thermoanaerobaculia bacterium]
MPKRIEREPFQSNKLLWPAHLLELLGKIPDATLARRAGISWSTVQEERRRRGIPPARPQRPPVDWSEDMIQLLGTAEDKEVAAELGIPTASVFRKRRILGIPAYRSRVLRKDPFWTSRRIARLGTAPDRDLAREWKVLPGIVCYHRVMLGIPPFHPPPRRVRWTANMTRLLGKIPDTGVAQRFGIGLRTVRAERLRRKIPPFRPAPYKVVRTPALRPDLSRPLKEAARRTGLAKDTLRKLRRDLGVPTPPRPSAWTKRALSRLGKVDDEVLARELGLKTSTVQLKRLKQGLRKKESRRWTAAEDLLVRDLPPAEAAQRLGRSLQPVQRRRAALGLLRSRPSGKNGEDKV